MFKLKLGLPRCVLRKSTFRSSLYLM